MGRSWTNKARKLGMLCAVNLSLYLNCFAGVDQGEKKVTLNVVQESCVKVFKQIERQTKMSFFYSTSDIKLPGKVSINVVNVALDEVMERILEGTGLEWIYSDNIITIRKKKSLAGGTSMENVTDSSINSTTVTGKVTSTDGTPIPGATIRVNRTAAGVTTDENGNFSIPETRINDILLVSSIGYQPREIQIKGRSVRIQLAIDINKLGETVVKGYYATTRMLNTGSVGKLRKEDISVQPVGDPIASLSGRITGLQVLQSSGVPGSENTILLRGRNSIANGNSPMYIIDGVPFPSTSLTNASIGGGATFLSPFNALNVNSIESIEVLKDGDATAIYGSRGANGVILITTKKGASGKATFNINVYSGIGKASRKMPLLNTSEYLLMRNEAFKNDNAQPGSGDYDVNGMWDSTRYTDWQKVLIGGTSHVTDVQTTLSGGTDNIQFLIGAGYRKEGTVFPGEFYDEKKSTNFGLTYTSVDKRFTANLVGSYSSNGRKIPLTDLTQFVILAPNAPPVYNPDGNLNWQGSTWNNPLATLEGQAKSSSDNLLSNLSFGYNIMPGLILKANLGYNKSTMNQSNIYPMSMYPPIYANFSEIRENRTATSRFNSWIIEPQISYEKRLGNAVLDILMGSTFQENIQEATSQRAYDFTDDALLENIAAAKNIKILSNIYTKYRYNAIFGRIGFNWKDKYLINLTGRRDGSSRFGNASKFGNFGSVGGAWIFTNEEILKNLRLLSFGKLRGSYGITGNDQIGDYQYLSTYSTYPYPYQGIPTLIPTGLTNSGYGWETVKKLELGIELGLLQDKLMVTTNFYRNRTNNQLVGYPLSSVTGFSSIFANLPAVVQNTGFEVELSGTILKNGNFSWNSSFNITFPRNKLVAYPNIEKSNYANVYVVGHSLFRTKTYHYLGVDPKTGIMQFEDVNKDGAITYPDDLLATKEISQNFYGGFQNSIKYKGLKLDIFFQYAKQTGRNNFESALYGAFFSGNSNQPKFILDRWKKTGDKSNIQRFSQDYGSEAATAVFNYSNSDKVITDASYLRLKNVSLSYQLSNFFLSKIHLQNLRIYVEGQNLFVITNYRGGLDPETQGLALPPIRTIVTGIQMSF